MNSRSPSVVGARNMAATEDTTLGVYLFDRRGAALLASPTGDRLPMEPTQVEGVLALAGGFDGDAHASVVRARYDDLGIVGMRGERTIAAMVSRNAVDERLVPELERFQRRCERRLRRRGIEE